MKLFIHLLFICLFATTTIYSQGIYLGVYNSSISSSCSNCHSAEIEIWAKTGHAKAQDSVSSAYYGYDCLQCHNTGWDPNTVNNGADEFVVKDTTQTPNYVITDQEKWDNVKNVQCESCHGTIGTADGSLDFSHMSGRQTDFSAENCGTCHQDSHHPYIEEWSTSAHSESEVVFFSRENNGDCYYCHYAQDFVAFLNDDDYDGTTFTPQNGIDDVLTCVTCHDPHGNENPGNLRSYEAGKIICDACHTVHTDVVDVTATPHHTTSEALDGASNFGFRYPGQTYTNSIHTVATPDRCANCHVHSGGDGNFGHATGHTFEPRVEACETCHADYTSVVDTSNHEMRFDYRGIQTEIKDLMATLKDKLDIASSADSTTDAFNQANYNYLAIDAEGSYGIHNTKLVRKLLEDAIADFIPTDVEVIDGVPTEYLLKQNYPNPFNPSTTIAFSLPETAEVSIEIYDAIGNKVTTLVNETKIAGNYEVTWNASTMATGIYLYKLKSNSFEQVNKMILLK
jgi:predicted CXXCH cytochrome family protein